MTEAWALTVPPAPVLKARQADLARFAMLIPQIEWRLRGPVNWRILWDNERRVQIHAWDVTQPLRPPLAVGYQGDRSLAVDVHDYTGARIASHTYDTGMGHNSRDLGIPWRYEPEVWHWEARPVYPFHWHVFVLREIDGHVVGGVSD